MNPLLRLENEHTFLNYEPDMKDPRDFVYRKGDYSFNFNYETPTFSANLNDSQQFFGSIFLITQYIKSYDDKLYKLLGDHEDICNQCFARYNSCNYRSLFRFFKEYMSSCCLRVAYTDLLYWRVLIQDVDKALEENVLFTGIPIFSDCLIKEENTIVCKIPNHNNKFLGYLPVMLKEERDDNYKALFISKSWEEANSLKIMELLVPKYLIHKCDPIIWSIKIQVDWFSNKSTGSLLDYVLDDYNYDVNSYEHYMKVGGVI
jgi:hypothetical protein